MRHSSALALVAFALLPAGCTTYTNPATGKTEHTIISVEQEIAVGNSVHQEMQQQSRISRDSRYVSRLHSIAGRIVAVCDRKEITFQFFVVEDNTINAMAIPGYIYVHTGALEAFADDELAFVIGHEVGHVAARHTAQKLQMNMGFELLQAILLPPERNPESAKAAELAYTVLMDRPYSRDAEFEADKIGLVYAHQAGFPPSGAVRAMEKLAPMEGGGPDPLSKYFSTHPPASARRKKLEAQAQQLGDAGTGAGSPASGSTSTPGTTSLDAEEAAASQITVVE